MPLKMGEYIAPPTPTSPPPSTAGGGAVGGISVPVEWPPGRRGVAAMTWTTHDGTEWDILSGADSLFVCDGLVGLGGMTQTEYTSEAAESDGQFYRAGRFGPRQVFWPTLVWDGADSGAEFTSWLERWNRGLSYHWHGTWMVRDARGIERRLKLRLVDPGDDHDRDPAVRGWATLGTKLVADRPHWMGTPQEMWIGGAGNLTTMFEPASNKIFRIASGSTQSRAVINNPGEVEAWPVWTIYGPCDSATIGVGNDVVTVPFRINEGEAFRLDTTDGQFIALLGQTNGELFTSGVDVVQRLSAWGAAPIQPGMNRPLTITVSGGQSLVHCTLTPLYYRGVA